MLSAARSAAISCASTLSTSMSVPFKPAPGSGAGIHFIGKFRDQCLVDLLRHGVSKTGRSLREAPPDYLVTGIWIKKDDKILFSGYLCQIEQLTGFHLFNCSATLFEKNSVPAVGAPDIDVDLDFLLAPCAFVRTCHI